MFIAVCNEDTAIAMPIKEKLITTHGEVCSLRVVEVRVGVGNTVILMEKAVFLVNISSAVVYLNLLLISGKLVDDV